MASLKACQGHTHTHTHTHRYTYTFSLLPAPLKPSLRSHSRVGPQKSYVVSLHQATSGIITIHGRTREGTAGRREVVGRHGSKQVMWIHIYNDALPLVSFMCVCVRGLVCPWTFLYISRFLYTTKIIKKCNNFTPMCHSHSLSGSSVASSVRTPSRKSN